MRVSTPPLLNPQRGEVWHVEFDPARGAEIRKTRPAVVLNVMTAGKLPLRVIVPLTEWQPPFARAFWHGARGTGQRQRSEQAQRR